MYSGFRGRLPGCGPAAAAFEGTSQRHAATAAMCSPSLVDRGPGLLLGVSEEDRIALFTLAEEAGGGEQQLGEHLGAERGVVDDGTAEGEES